MVDVTEISAIVAAVGVLIGVAYYIMDMRNQAQKRQTDLVMQLYSEFGSKEYVEAMPKLFLLEFKDYEDFKQKYPTSTFATSEASTSYTMYCYFFEKVGLLLHRKLIDIELVDDLFSMAITICWEKVRPIVEGRRKEWNTPQYWEWFEYLYNELKKREQKLQQSKISKTP